MTAYNNNTIYKRYYLFIIDNNNNNDYETLYYNTPSERGAYTRPFLREEGRPPSS